MNGGWDRINQAFEFALALHKNQVRKVSGTPFIAHLLGVASLVMENGGTENQVIAALLHDSVEDQGGMPILAEIESRFGPQVAGLVKDLSDSFVQPKPPWQERKERYLEALPRHNPDAWLISLADKLHNGRSLLREFDRIGESVWNGFNGGKSGTLWYYRTLADFFSVNQPGYMARELERIVEELETRVNA